MLIGIGIYHREARVTSPETRELFPSIQQLYVPYSFCSFGAKICRVYFYKYRYIKTDEFVHNNPKRAARGAYYSSLQHSECGENAICRR